MDKLILNFQIIQIGLKLSWIGIIIIMISGCCIFCDETLPEEQYLIAYYNKTSDTVVLDKFNTISNSVVESYEIFPNETTLNRGSVGINKGENPIIKYLEGLQTDIYNYNLKINDSVKVRWSGPVKDMGDTINHIYNVNSWEIITYDSISDGEIRFTIYESDFD